MNLNYLDTLPEVENEFAVKLEEGEKCVFNARLSTFGNEKGESLDAGGENARFTLTNRKMVINNGIGVWTNDLAEDVGKIVKTISKFLWMKSTYYKVSLNAPSVYYMGNKKCYQTGFELYFKDEDIERFGEIVSKVYE